MDDMAEKLEIQISKPKNNLPPEERKALKGLKNNTEINIKKADKGTTSWASQTRRPKDKSNLTT